MTSEFPTVPETPTAKSQWEDTAPQRMARGLSSSGPAEPTMIELERSNARTNRASLAVNIVVGLLLIGSLVWTGGAMSARLDKVEAEAAHNRNAAESLAHLSARVATLETVAAALEKTQDRLDQVLAELSREQRRRGRR